MDHFGVKQEHLPNQYKTIKQLMWRKRRFTKNKHCNNNNNKKNSKFLLEEILKISLKFSLQKLKASRSVHTATCNKKYQKLVLTFTFCHPGVICSGPFSGHWGESLPPPKKTSTLQQWTLVLSLMSITCQLNFPICWVSEKTNEPIPRTNPDKKTDRRKDGLSDPNS